MLKISVKPIPNSIQSQKIRLQRFRFPAPKFWLVKVTAAWAKALAISYVKYSKFSAREDPAMASSPKELIPLWINTLDTEKIAP